MPRKKTTPLEDLVTIISRLPWWVGVTLALLSYLLLSLYVKDSAVPVIVNGRPENFIGFTADIIFRGIAAIGQYLLPFVFSVGAGISLYKKIKRSKLLLSVAGENAESNLDAMSWLEFETMVGEAFRKQGYKVTETPEGPDGGVDLVLEKGVKKILVQCKHWKAQKVGVKTARELFGVLVDSGADEVNIVCSGKFTNDAKEFVKNKAIYLIDGEQLLTLIENVA